MNLPFYHIVFDSTQGLFFGPFLASIHANTVCADAAFFAAMSMTISTKVWLIRRLVKHSPSTYHPYGSMYIENPAAIPLLQYLANQWDNSSILLYCLAFLSPRPPV